MRSILIPVLLLSACVYPPEPAPIPFASTMPIVSSGPKLSVARYRGYFDGGSASLIIYPFGNAGMGHYIMTGTGEGCRFESRGDARLQATHVVLGNRRSGIVVLDRKGAGWTFISPPDNPRCTFSGELQPGA